MTALNLFGLSAVNEEIQKRITRSNLANLLDTYADEADVFNEMVQNAFDAVMKAIELGYYKDGDQPCITIVIGRRIEGHHYFFVSDDGIGMPPEVAANITVPGFTHGKKKGKTVGYKGVGASYFFATSQRIALSTTDVDGVKTEYTVRGSYEWITNDGEPDPTIEDVCDIHPSLNKYLPEQRGTAIYFQFHDGLRPKNLNNLVIVSDGPETELKNWMCFLASKTALGAVADLTDRKIRVRAVLDRGDDETVQLWNLGPFDRENSVAGYPFPHAVVRNAKDVCEIDATPHEQKYKHSRKYPAVYKRWSAADIIKETSKLEQEEQDKLLAHLEWVDGYLGSTVEPLKLVNERLGGRHQLIRHGMRIAVDGVPQGRNVDLSLTSDQGLDRQTHVVLAFRGLKLDVGRKISSDETAVSAIAKIGRRVVDVLKEYRWAMKKKDRPDIASDLGTWRTNVESRTTNSLVREFFNLRDVEPALRVDPDSESEVIALFVALLDAGVLKGFRVSAISGFARYDCLCDVDTESAGVRSLDDQFSVRDFEGGLNGSMRVLEFKHRFDSLIQDFQDKLKNPAEIDLAVCWDLPDLNVSRGSLQPTYGKWRDERLIYAGTYVWMDDNETSRIPVIALKTFLAEYVAKLEADAGKPGIGKAFFAQIEQSDKDNLV